MDRKRVGTDSAQPCGGTAGSGSLAENRRHNRYRANSGHESNEGSAASLRDVKVERGMMLLQREPERNGVPERFKLWTVASVRHGAKSSAVTLIMGDQTFTAEAKATFPGGTLGENWKLFGLSNRDLAFVWGKLDG